MASDGLARAHTASMDAMLLWLNGAPRSFRKPWAAISAAMARRLICPPLGFLRASRFAKATASGFVSDRLLRPSTLTPVARFRSGQTVSVFVALCAGDHKSYRAYERAKDRPKDRPIRQACYHPYDRHAHTTRYAHSLAMAQSCPRTGIWLRCSHPRDERYPV